MSTVPKKLDYLSLENTGAFLRSNPCLPPTREVLWRSSIPRVTLIRLISDAADTYQENSFIYRLMSSLYVRRGCSVLLLSGGSATEVEALTNFLTAMRAWMSS